MSEEITQEPAQVAVQQPQQIAKPTPPKVPVAWGEQGVILNSLDEAFRFAQAVAASPFVPKGMEKPGDILVALQAGAEMGLSPMQALQSLAIVNGRPSIYGDAALALVRKSGLMTGYSQQLTGEGEQRRAVVKCKRGDEEYIQEFSVADAKRAGLWGKAGPWTQHPDRMLQFRARGFILRDAFGDVLKGLRTTEEAQDIPPARAAMPSLDAINMES
jgi:hypothetical protein